MEKEIDYIVCTVEPEIINNDISFLKKEGNKRIKFDGKKRILIKAIDFRKKRISVAEELMPINNK